MTSSLNLVDENLVDEILALDKPRSLICAIESTSGEIAKLYFVPHHPPTTSWGD
ncbi:hypothetical protein [Microcoleus sp. FACHB-SPT15]|uniref:hypothetical protein n=1 Tax=Microcoleus sp. FACHB-SPT15 TaxID=2692830 RepID=UPI0028C41445|nr:hypothetical protein [Microcoleus sp. FACHB-SPT15]